MTNLEFLLSLKEGDFVTSVDTTGRALPLIACFHRFDAEEDKRFTDEYHNVEAKFFLGHMRRFRVNDTFGCNDSNKMLRKPTMEEMFQLSDAIRKEGYVYDRKSKTLIKVR